jgi:comEA protein
MKRLGVVLLILVFGLMFAPSSFAPFSFGVAFAQDEEEDFIAPPEEPPSEDAGIEGEEEFAGQQVNVNTATAEELAAVEGIEEMIAQNIVEYREANGPFDTLDDLKAVKGIGTSKIEKIREYVTVE